MTDEQSTTKINSSLPRAVKLRIAAFFVLILACAWYSGIFQSIWSSFVPRMCADGKTALFSVDFHEVPARLGPQFNACAQVADGECQRTAENLALRGECRQGRMTGKWSLTNTKSEKTEWKGSFCNGLPCGEFHSLVNGNHENVFHVENLHIHGMTTIWETHDGKLTQSSGEYKFGKRNGRWVHYAEPEHKMISTAIYDEGGFLSTVSYYCTNGHRKEVRGNTVFYYDAGGNALANENNSENSGNDLTRCPLP